MDKFAVIRIGGKQYRVSEGEEILVDKLTDLKTLPEVLLIADGEKVEIGKPVLTKSKVTLKVVTEVEKGEKIDIVNWDEDPARFVCNAIAPAEVSKVIIREHEKVMEVVVPDDQLSLAIGRRGQNVRLAVKLTGWHIDIKSESAKKAAAAAQKEQKMDDFTGLGGVGEKTAEILVKAGFKTVDSLANATVESLTALQGIGEKTAQKIIDSAKKVSKANAGEPAPEVKNGDEKKEQ